MVILMEVLEGSRGLEVSVIHSQGLLQLSSQGVVFLNRIFELIPCDYVPQSLQIRINLTVE